MKKLIFALVIAITIFSLASCGNSSENPPEREDVITIEDGYLVVNGVKTEYKVDTEDVITVEDGYLVVNGVKTEYKVETEDVITVENGYLVVNGVKTEHKVDTGDVITVEDGYLVVNGVKTEYKVSECEHIWETVTTAPTCTAGGYDTMTCKLCEKSVKTNETALTKHNYGNDYYIDNDYHWFKCIGCDASKDKELHTLGDDGVCTVCQLPVSATPGVIYDLSDDRSYAMVVGYNGAATKVKIAEEYQGLPVKNIYDNAFEGQTIESVVIPDSVTSIGGSAFFNCDFLTSVVIPDNVTTIGGFAFGECSSLTSVVIGDSVTTIDGHAFSYCTYLTSVVIGDSVTHIGSGAFGHCYFLTSVVIPNSVTSIDYYAFEGCSSLTSVVIGDSVTTIGERAFSDCDSLTDVYYTGTEEEWAKINIGRINYYLTNAEIHYNYVPEE